MAPQIQTVLRQCLWIINGREHIPQRQQHFHILHTTIQNGHSLARGRLNFKQLSCSMDSLWSVCKYGWQVDDHILQLQEGANNCSNMTMQTKYVCKEPKLFVKRIWRAQWWLKLTEDQAKGAKTRCMGLYVTQPLCSICCYLHVKAFVQDKTLP